MFNIKHNECVGFESRWKVKKVSLVGSTQTTEYSNAEMETSTSEKKDVDVQTDVQLPTTNYEVDEEKLAAWLKRIYPSVKKELDDVASSRAFRNYRLSTDTSDAVCKCVQSVNVSKILKDPDIGSYISALSWNCTNNTLAVSCIYKHNGWCYHEGFVAFYTLDRDDNLPEAPRLKLQTESCVTVLEFHPLFPGIAVAGLFSGSIIVWNIQKEDDQFVVKIEGNGNCITQVSWIPDINSSKNILLASSSLDGLLTLWNFNHSEGTLIAKERHRIQSPLFPKPRESPGETLKNVNRGITCFDFSKHAPEMFLVGAEGGLVVQCSLLGTRKLKGEIADVPLLDSVFKYYEPHKGEISSVSFSPNRKDMFLTSGSDLEIRIYMIDQEEPAQVIFLKQPLSCVTWVPYEEKIICGCGTSGLIEIFDLIKGKLIENTTKEKVKPQPLTQIRINCAKTNIVAVATDNGQILMWRVPWALFGNNKL